MKRALNPKAVQRLREEIRSLELNRQIFTEDTLRERVQRAMIKNLGKQALKR